MLQKGIYDVIITIYACYKPMFHVFYLDIAYDAMAIHICFKVFQMYVSSVSSRCCMCYYGYIRMFQAYVSSVSDVSNLCCKYFI
jgi:hypothetical protein